MLGEFTRHRPIRHRRANGSLVACPYSPIVSDDVAAALAEVTLAAPVNGMIEIAGPERLSLDELVRRFLRGKQDARQVVTDVHARYFGVDVNDQSLTPGDNPRIGLTRFGDWLSRSAAQR